MQQRLQIHISETATRELNKLKRRHHMTQEQALAHVMALNAFLERAIPAGQIADHGTCLESGPVMSRMINGQWVTVRLSFLLPLGS